MSSDPGRAVALIERAADLLESGWCQRAYALTADGREVHSSKPSAVAWCASGALMRARDEVLGTMAPHLYGAAVNDLTNFLIEREGPMTISAYNDAPGRKKEEVVALFRDYLATRRRRT